MKDFKEIIGEIKNDSLEYGHYDEKTSFSDFLLKCHNSLFEAFREHKGNNLMLYYRVGKPKGISINLADCLIEIFSFCSMYDINIEEAVKVKYEYNLKISKKGRL